MVVDEILLKFKNYFKFFDSLKTFDIGIFALPKFPQMRKFGNNFLRQRSNSVSHFERGAAIYDRQYYLGDDPKSVRNGNAVALYEYTIPRIIQTFSEIPQRFHV